MLKWGFVTPFLTRAPDRMGVSRSLYGPKRGLLFSLVPVQAIWMAAAPSKGGKPREAERDPGKRPERKDDKGFQKGGGKPPKRDKQ